MSVLRSRCAVKLRTEHNVGVSEGLLKGLADEVEGNLALRVMFDLDGCVEAGIRFPLKHAPWVKKMSLSWPTSFGGVHQSHADCGGRTPWRTANSRAWAALAGQHWPALPHG